MSDASSSKQRAYGIKRAKKLLKLFDKNENNLRQYNYDNYIDKIESGRYTKHGEINIYYLFQFIPILTRHDYSNKSKYLLFGVLPLYKTKESQGRVKHYLFGFLPIFKTKIIAI